MHIQTKLLHHTLLSLSHTPVINWAVCLLVVVALLEVSEREVGVVALHLHDEPFKKKTSGLGPVAKCEPSTFQPISHRGRYWYIGGSWKYII